VNVRSTHLRLPNPELVSKRFGRSTPIAARFNFHLEKHMSKQAEDRPYGKDRAVYHQQVSNSDPCDSRGRVAKNAQQVRQDAPAKAHPHKSEPTRYDPRLPSGAGDYAEGTRSSVRGSRTTEPSNQNQKAQPSHGGSVPSHKDPTEGTGSNYHKNRNQTRIPGDGAVTVRTVMDKKEVRRNLVDADQDVSSRT